MNIIREASKGGCMLLPLQQGILYGPINSRRLGRSLGINLMPSAYKLCSFNCVYCHYGLTKVLTHDLRKYCTDLPATEQVLDTAEQVMRSGLEFDYITFSGNGEPTLHPDFHEIVHGLVALRNKYRRSARIALLSNSTGLVHESVRSVISLIDVPVFKLDAGTETVFKKVNRPARGISFDTIVSFMQGVPGIYIQTVLMRGLPSNAHEEALSRYFTVIARIKPHEAQIYSLDRAAPQCSITKVSPTELETIAARGSRETGITIRAFYL